MNANPKRELEEEKKELLSQYCDDELQMYRNILENGRCLASEPITVVEIRSEVGTDGK